MEVTSKFEGIRYEAANKYVHSEWQNFYFFIKEENPLGHNFVHGKPCAMKIIVKTPVLCNKKSSNEKHDNISATTGDTPMQCNLIQELRLKLQQRLSEAKPTSIKTEVIIDSAEVQALNATLKEEVQLKLLHEEVDLKEESHSCDYFYESMTCNTKCTDSSMSHIPTQITENFFTCKICTQIFNGSGNLRRHIRTHTGEKPFRCKICTRKFTQSSGLKIHIRTHTGEKPFECKVCTYKCTNGRSLKSHVRTHTGEKPFECKICTRKFSNSGNLSMHKRIHTGERPLICKICFSKFTQSSSLKRHITTHTGEKPYECNLCTNKFNESSKLKRHVLRKHKSETVDYLKMHGTNYTDEHPF